MTPIFAVSSLGDLSALEVHHLYKLRVDVFVHEQQCPYKEIDDIDALPTTKHILAWQTGNNSRILLGTARVFPDTRQGQEVTVLGRYLVAESERGTGLDRELMFQALRYIQQTSPERPVFIHAQDRLSNYYAKNYGFQGCGEVFMEDGIPHRPMILSPEALADFVLSHEEERSA